MLNIKKITKEQFDNIDENDLKIGKYIVHPLPKEENDFNPTVEYYSYELSKEEIEEKKEIVAIERKNYILNRLRELLYDREQVELGIRDDKTIEEIDTERKSLIIEIKSLNNQLSEI